MCEDENAPVIDLQLLERTARVLATRRRLEDGYRRLMKHWSDAGFTEGAVMRAIEALEADLPGEFEDMKGAQRILQTLKAPVQLELLKMAETRVPETVSNVHEIAFDAGFFARFEGRDRRPVIEGRRLTDQDERASWFAGYDEADGLLRTPEPMAAD